MKGTVLFSALLLIFAFSCTPYGETPIEEDFIDPEVIDEGSRIDSLIEDLLSKSVSGPDDAALHRKLAVYYRILGTPYSRKMSLDEIDRAIRLEPDNPLNHVERGMTLYAMRFTGDAERSFREAARIDPGTFHAWFQLARIEKDKYLRNMCFNEHLEASIDYFKKAFNIDGSHEETLFNLAFLHMLRGMYGTSSGFSIKALEKYPANPRHYLMAGSLNLRRGRFSDSAGRFDQALNLMDEGERSVYEDVGPLLALHERESYYTFTEEKRKEYIRKYWIRNDPTPATPVNERLLTHYERVFLADELLTNRRLGLEGAETVRGISLISYGLPDKFLYDLGQWVYGPIVIWEYGNRGNPIRLYFQDEFLNGDYHIPVDPQFRHLAEQTRFNLDYVPQIYEYPVEYLPMPLLVQKAQSLGTEGRTRFDYSIAFPDSAIARPRESHSIVLSVFDFDWNRFLNNIYTFRPDTLTMMTRSEGSFYIFTFSVDIAYREFDCFFSFELSGGTPFRRGTWNEHCSIYDMGGGAMVPSDIRLALHGPRRECTQIIDPLPVYPAEGSICVSYDIYNLKLDVGNMARYRLTYMIRDPGIDEEELGGIRKTLYWIKRGIRGGDKEISPYISSTIEQSVNSPTARNDLKIDLGSLEPGKYLLVLLIEDLVGGEVASREKTFVVTNLKEVRP